MHVKKCAWPQGSTSTLSPRSPPASTGADLANLVNEAALHATRGGAEAVSADDFTLAIERIVAGLEKNDLIPNPRERKVIASITRWAMRSSRPPGRAWIPCTRSRSSRAA